MDFVIFILKRPLMSIFIFVSSFGLFMLIANTLNNKEYENAINGHNRVIKCGFYKGIENKKIYHFRPSVKYLLFMFDNENFITKFQTGLYSFNFGQNKFYKQQLKSVKIGDRVCLTISNGLVIEFNIQK